ncbi:hypothetical protein CAEBREN_24584 [Caenorhabditis brenneri]|uniref:Uncharacterized protein n=1 Tax=Caenorhabditis brenneri TaxID=135651 RepID=G0MWI8_CAEBE|nr:hypothetical protein CAEBREN_24584 [Caenorhabditis brenneri]
MAEPPIEIPSGNKEQTTSGRFTIQEAVAFLEGNRSEVGRMVQQNTEIVLDLMSQFPQFTQKFLSYELFANSAPAPPLLALLQPGRAPPPPPLLPPPPPLLPSALQQPSVSIKLKVRADKDVSLASNKDQNSDETKKVNDYMADLKVKIKEKRLTTTAEEFDEKVRRAKEEHQQSSTAIKPSLNPVQGKSLKSSSQLEEGNKSYPQSVQSEIPKPFELHQLSHASAALKYESQDSPAASTTADIRTPPIPPPAHLKPKLIGTNAFKQSTEVLMRQEGRRAMLPPNHPRYQPPEEKGEVKVPEPRNSAQNTEQKFNEKKKRFSFFGKGK